MSTTSKIIYTGGLRTSAEHTKSGTKIISDAPVDNQGKGEAFSPTDLVATALGSCILTIMGIRARDKNLDINGATTEVTKTMASDPRRISMIDIRLNMPPNNYTEKDKKLLAAAANACPVGNSLHPDIAVSVEIIWA